MAFATNRSQLTSVQTKDAYCPAGCHCPRWKYSCIVTACSSTSACQLRN